MKRANRLFSFILSVIMLSTVLVGFNFSANAQDYAQELRDKGFPESYINDLVELHKIHPRWIFEPMDTNLSWQDAVNGERSYHNKQLISMTNNIEDYFCNCSSCATWNEQTQSYDYKIREGSSWVAASETAVKKYMDPRNWLDERHIFQFESNRHSDIETIDGIESIIANTWMSYADITYKDAQGYEYTFYLNGNPVKYSEAIMQAAQNTGMSSYYLASRIIQEIGRNQTSAGSSGTYPGYEGIYNYYSIGANTGAEAGLKWASYNATGDVARTNVTCNIRTQPWVSHNPENSLGKVNSGTEVKILNETGVQSDGYTWYQVETYIQDGSYVSGYIRSDLVDNPNKADKYNRPWTNPYLSIVNGATWIAEGYGEYQFTGYLEKFNVNNVSGNRLHTHEYMSNVQAPSTEATSKYKAYYNAGQLEIAKVFSIPVFRNMPGDKSTMVDDIKVTNLRTYDIGSKSLSYVWDAVPNAVDYDVSVRNNTKGTTFSATSDGTFVKVGNLTNGNNYTIYVTPIIARDDGTQFRGSSTSITNTTGSLTNGWKVIENEWYYYDTYYECILSNGWRLVNDDWFYFYPNGVMAHDTEMADSTSICYLDSNGYILRNSWAYTTGGWRYFGSDGYLVVNSIVDDSRGTCYVDENGYQIFNRWMYDEYGWFLIGTDGYVVKNQIVEDSIGKLYLDNGGRMVANTWFTIGGYSYRTDSNGYLVINDIVKDEDGMYYLNDQGVLMSNYWLWYDNGWMYASDTGRILTSAIIRDSHGIVYLDSNGRMTSSRWAYVQEGWVYVNADGYLTTNAMVRDYRDLCFLDENGIMVTNRWILIPNGWVYFDENGHIVRNNTADDSHGTAYLDENGFMVSNRWIKLEDHWIYVDEYGYLVKGSFVEGIYGTLYLDEDGVMIENRWYKIDDNWMYFGRDGYLAKDMLVRDYYGYCYVDESGIMLTNRWVYVDDAWRNFDNDGHMQTKKFVNDYYGTCYVDADGKMVYDQYITDENGKHYIDKNGYLVKN